MKLREWMEETHGRLFELTRHFLAQFFESELVTDPQKLVVGAASGLAAIGLLVPKALYGKYLELSSLDDPTPFLRAALADKLFFIALSMVVVGFVAAMQWQSLFPARRDIHILVPLPVEARQVFMAKFAALILFVGIFVVAVNLIPALTLPTVIRGKHLPYAIGWTALLAHWIAAGLGGFFVAFAIAAVQGVMTQWSRVAKFSPAAQALAMLALLCATPQLFKIFSTGAWLLSKPAEGIYLPPLWFLGLYETALGSDDPYWNALGDCALGATAAVFLATVALYAISYKRSASEAVEGQASARSWAVWSRLADRLAPNSGERAAISFIVKTLMRSSRHKVLLAAYVGIGFAVVLDGWLIKEPRLGWLLSSPLVFSFFLISGMRFVFSIPFEAGGNWVFRLSEEDRRRDLLAAVDRLFLWAGVVPVSLAAFPVQAAAAGLWPAAVHLAIGTMLALVLVEITLADYARVPFTCAYLPGDRNASHTFLLYWMGFSAYAFTASAIEQWAIGDPWRVVMLAGALAALFAKLRIARREHWNEEPIDFEPVAEPVVQQLRILRE